MSGRKLRTVLSLHAVLAGILLLGQVTDLSLSGVVADFVFPPLVGLFALRTFVWLRAVADRRRRRAARLLPAALTVAGCLPACLVALLAIPPFTLGLLFMIDEIGGEVMIQEAVSPDRTRTARVYFRGVGAYSGGNGRIFVRIRPRWLPIVERDVYSLGRSDATEDTTDYVRWVDNDTLYLSEERRELGLGRLRYERPLPLRFLLFVVGLIWAPDQDGSVPSPAPLRTGRTALGSPAAFACAAETSR